VSISKIQLLLTVLTSTCNGSSRNTAHLSHHTTPALHYFIDLELRTKLWPWQRRRKGTVPPAKMAEKSDMILSKTWFSLCSGRHMLGVQFRTSLESKLWTAVVRWNTTENSVTHNSPCILLTGHAKIFFFYSPPHHCTF
jgi:hypothetical protein